VGLAHYPVKRVTEQVRLAVTPAEQQVELHLEFARQRLQEWNSIDRVVGRVLFCQYSGRR
jgi:hypothetical protein